MMEAAIRSGRSALLYGFGPHRGDFESRTVQGEATQFRDGERGQGFIVARFFPMQGSGIEAIDVGGGGASDGPAQTCVAEGLPIPAVADGTAQIR